MKKKNRRVWRWMCAVLLCCVTGCGIENGTQADTTTKVSPSAGQSGSTVAGKQKELIVFFTTQGITAYGEPVDGISSASLDPDYISTDGNTGTVAMLLHGAAESIMQIVPQERYPADGDAFASRTLQEQREESRPQLMQSGRDLGEYDCVYLVYPIWWGDLPMPVYTFLETNQFEGVTIAPVCVHDGSGAFDTAQTIADVTGAAVTELLTLDEEELGDAKALVSAWRSRIGR